EMACIATFKNAEEFVEHLEGLRVQIVLMDIGLPGMSGIECIRKYGHKRTDIEFVMYTTHFDSSEVFEALRAGAKGYILKGGSPERLIQDIFDISEGGSPMSPQISRLVAESFYAQEPTNSDLHK